MAEIQPEFLWISGVYNTFCDKNLLWNVMFIQPKNDGFYPA